MFKKITLALCVLALLLLVACKQDTTNSGINSTPSQVGESDTNTQGNQSGIELEEDVFEGVEKPTLSTDSAMQSTTSNNVSKGENAHDKDDSANNSSSDESSQNVQSDVSVDQDGTITLPIDKFD